MLVGSREELDPTYGLTSTAGSIDDADVAGDYVSGLKGASAIDTPSIGLAEVEMWRPFVRDGLDNWCPARGAATGSPD